MAGVEILFGVAGLLTPLLAAPAGSAVRKRFCKPRYDYYSDRDEVCDHFIESWTSLNSNVLRLLSIIRKLAHDDHSRRTVLKELERTTKVFQDLNSHLLACKPIGGALREQEKTEIFLEAIGRKIEITRIMASEKMATVLGSTVAAKPSSSSLNSSNRESNLPNEINRNLQNMKYNNSRFHDEGFFDGSQSLQSLRIASSRANYIQDNKNPRNTTPTYEYDGLKPHRHRHRKRHHNSSAPRSPPSGITLPSHENYSQTTLCGSRHEKRYHDDQW